jgi:hypothetical protein
LEDDALGRRIAGGEGACATTPPHRADTDELPVRAKSLSLHCPGAKGVVSGQFRHFSSLQKWTVAPVSPRGVTKYELAPARTHPPARLVVVVTSPEPGSPLSQKGSSK